jgi:chromosome segregation ATPase
MPVQLSRAELLEANIAAQQQELAELQSTNQMNQRMKATADALRNFRKNTADQRDSIIRLDGQIDDALAALHASCEGGHVAVNGMLMLSENGKRSIDSATNNLQQLVLARYRTMYQLTQSEARLATMEADNASLSPANRV